MAVHERRGSGSSPGRVELLPRVGLSVFDDCCAALVHHRHAAAAGPLALPSGRSPLQCNYNWMLLGGTRLLLQAVHVLDLVLRLNCTQEQGMQGPPVKANLEIVILQASSLVMKPVCVQCGALWTLRDVPRRSLKL